MINSRTATWTVFVFELVLSTAAFMASLAIICAQLQSISNYEDRKSPSRTLLVICVVSFLLSLATIFAMIGLASRRPAMILPHILLMAVVLCLCSYRLFEGVFRNGTEFDNDWLMSVTSSTVFTSAQIGALYLEMKVCRDIILLS
ncbi:hypothetical protein Tcan_18434 [Toxocara canis]|uniref:Uncharacterized protein n=1 Tax=Toxocara canis TaxID=6265 RepID=A0A0B2VQG8_TOXCA|nr:hypothetical protein Tcan_18434 [Toxocara canis]